MHILLTGNTSFKIANFRAGLIAALIADGHAVTILAPVDDYTHKLTAMGCHFVPLKMTRNGTSLFGESALALAMLNIIRRIRPDVVLSYTIKNNIYSGIACRILKIPFAPNVTGMGPAFNDAGLLNTVVRLLYRVAFRRAARVFFQNADDQAVFLKGKLVAETHARLLPGSGVDLQSFQFQPAPPNAHGIIFLFVGRLLWDKGIGVMIDAARSVLAKHPSTKFHVLGPLDQESKSAIPKFQIDAWEMEGIITYLGSTSDVRPVLAASHCVVLPSYYREGTPRSLIEACAVGRPIVTTDMPGCRDVVASGENGFLCHPRDSMSLANEMLKFIDLSDQKRAAMGAASRTIAEGRFSETLIISAYKSLLIEVAKEEAN